MRDVHKGTPGKVNLATFSERSTIGDFNHHPFPVLLIGHPKFGAERYLPVGGCVFTVIELLSASGAPSIKLIGIIGRMSILLKSLAL